MEYGSGRATSFVLAASLLLAPLPARAETWLLVTSANDGSQYYQDTSSIRRDENVAVVWEKVVYPEARPNGTKYRIARYRYNCEAGTGTVLNATTYKDDGSVVYSVTYATSEQKERQLVPESVGRELLDAICSNQ